MVRRHTSLFIVIFFFLLLVGGLFYKSVLHGQIPFPADLLLSEYAPFRHTEYFGYAAGGIPSKGQYFDVVRELYPWKTLVTTAIRQKTLPLWNPYSFSGTPLLANYQSQVFYPLGLVYLVLPQPVAWTIMMALQLLLGMVFMYLFARVIGLSLPAALAAALTFNLSSFATSWIEFNTVWHTILWLPLLLYLFERGTQQKKLTRKEQCLFIFALFSSMTAGHPQDFINTFLFFSVYAVLRLMTNSMWSKTEKIRFSLTTLLPVIAIPFLLASVQLIPTVELFGLSARVPHDIKQILSTMLIQLWQLPMLVYQDFFGNPATKTYAIPDTYVGKTLSIGVVGFILGLWSLFTKQKNWHKKFFTVAAAVMLILSINTPLAALLYRFPVPILSTGTPTRNLFVFLFALAILAGFGLDALVKKEYQAKKFLLVSITAVACIWLLTLLLPRWVPLLIPTLLKKSAFIISALIFCSAVCMMMRKYTSVVIYGFLALIIAELGYGFLKFNPFVPASFVYPENTVFTYMQKNAGLYRFWGYGTARFESNLNAQYRVYSTDGTDPLNLRWYNQFMQASKDGYLSRVFSRTTRSDAGFAAGYGARDLPDNAYRLRIMDLTGVKYVLDRPENPKDNTTFDQTRFAPVTTLANNYTVFENKLVYPRAFLVSEYQTYTSVEAFEKQFFSNTFNPRKTVLLPAGTRDITLGQATEATASITSYTPNSIVIQTNSNAPQLLFLSDAYAPGWQATLDGKQTEVLRADYAFRAVSVPAGIHTIRFSYAPLSVTIGFIGSGIGILCACLYFLLPQKKQKK